MYDLMIRLYNELDYKKFKVENLKEIMEILKQYEGNTSEITFKKIKVKSGDKE